MVVLCKWPWRNASPKKQGLQVTTVAKGCRGQRGKDMGFQWQPLEKGDVEEMVGVVCGGVCVWGGGGGGGWSVGFLREGPGGGRDVVGRMGVTWTRLFKADTPLSSVLNPRVEGSPVCGMRIILYIIILIRPRIAPGEIRTLVPPKYSPEQTRIPILP